MASRGHWLEAATQASLEIYQRQGLCCVQKIATPSGFRKDGQFFRSQSTVDFVGVFSSVPIAFDCKVTKLTAFPLKNVHPHQVRFLENFHDAGGLGALLIAFDGRGTGSYLVSHRWWTHMAGCCGRASVPLSAFEAEAADPLSECLFVAHGASGVPCSLKEPIYRLAQSRHLPYIHGSR